MKREKFNDGWRLREKADVWAGPGAEPASTPVTLPHDAMISRKRDAGVPGGRSKGYFPGGHFEYVKTFTLGDEYRGRHVVFEFEGVYRNAVVLINKEAAGQRPYGYSGFYVDADAFIRPGENTIRVGFETSDDSRWYTGAGIYRNVNIISGGLTRFGLDGVRIRIAAIHGDSGCAVVTIKSAVESDERVPFAARVVTEIIDSEKQTVAIDTAPVSVFPGETVARARLVVDRPRLWDTETPWLYTCRSTLLDEAGAVLDTEETVFGIRVLELDARAGLTLNGKPIKLRGACIHHDNGVIGAATFERAEERRAALMKAAGFNALRSAHHPMSRAMLAACDHLGLLVMDEAFDMWTLSKTPADYAASFPEWFERDVTAMVAKDYNHPCVALYSIGNEIPDTGTRSGARWGRRIAETIRALDPDRFVINAINGMLSAIDRLPARPERDAGAAADINDQMADLGAAMKTVMDSDAVSRATEESYACVDVAGYNYMDTRYVSDGERYPNRVICGSETFPRDIFANWRLVTRLPYVIGDFTWTGWDYLGEAGLGRIERGRRTLTSLAGPYPWIAAWCGDFDLTGRRRPVSYYREIVWGLRETPFIAVEDPSRHGMDAAASPWAWSDVAEIWTWPGREGMPVRVEVYSGGDDVALLLDGRPLGKAPVGLSRGCVAVFETVYRPGVLEAVAYRGGKETGRSSLATAGEPAALELRPERDPVKAGAGDLAYVAVNVVDAAGRVNPAAERRVTVTVTGSGVLQGFGGANPVTEEDYVSGVHTTFEGRALAVLRPTGPGEMRLRAECAGLPPAEITIAVD